MTDVGTTVDTLQLFGEPSRVRLLALLAKDELTVAELVAATGLVQSRVSTHLGKLREAGVVRDRKEGASTYYALANGAMPRAARTVWSAIESSIDDAQLVEDRERVVRVLKARETRGAWPDAVAGEMERHYSPGRTWESLARGLLALSRFGDVVDVGCGDGAVAQLVAPRAKSVTCVDRNGKDGRGGEEAPRALEERNVRRRRRRVAAVRRGALRIRRSSSTASRASRTRRRRRARSRASCGAAARSRS